MFLAPRRNLRAETGSRSATRGNKSALRQLSVVCLTAYAHLFALASSASASAEVDFSPVPFSSSSADIKVLYQNPFVQETLLAQTSTSTTARSLRECAPSNTVNHCLVRHCTDKASPTACLENNQHDPDCCATRGSGSCKAGYKQAKTHASTCHSGVSAFTTCCYDMTALGMTDIELSDHLGEPALNPALTCSEAWCTSPGVPEGTKDCFAGSDTEPCTCSRGEAVQLGETTEFMGKTYYRYVCCEKPQNGESAGANFVGENCGDYEGGLAAVVAILITVIVIGCCCCCAVGIVWAVVRAKQNANANAVSQQNTPAHGNYNYPNNYNNTVQAPAPGQQQQQQAIFNPQTGYYQAPDGRILVPMGGEHQNGMQMQQMSAYPGMNAAPSMQTYNGAYVQQGGGNTVVGQPVGAPAASPQMPTFYNTQKEQSPTFQHYPQGPIQVQLTQSGGARASNEYARAD